jgi:hypothetical protein
MAGRSPSPRRQRTNLESAMPRRESRPCEPSPSAECRSSARLPTPPGLVASVDLQPRSGLARGGGPPPLFVERRGTRDDAACALFICFYHRARHDALRQDSRHTQCHTHV